MRNTHMLKLFSGDRELVLEMGLAASAWAL